MQTWSSRAFYSLRTIAWTVLASFIFMPLGLNIPSVAILFLFAVLLSRIHEGNELLPLHDILFYGIVVWIFMSLGLYAGNYAPSVGLVFSVLAVALTLFLPFAPKIRAPLLLGNIIFWLFLTHPQRMVSLPPIVTASVLIFALFVLYELLVGVSFHMPRRRAPWKIFSAPRKRHLPLYLGAGYLLSMAFYLSLHHLPPEKDWIITPENLFWIPMTYLLLIHGIFYAGEWGEHKMLGTSTMFFVGLFLTIVVVLLTTQLRHEVNINSIVILVGFFAILVLLFSFAFHSLLGTVFVVVFTIYLEPNASGPYLKGRVLAALLGLVFFLFTELFYRAIEKGDMFPPPKK